MSKLPKKEDGDDFANIKPILPLSILIEEMKQPQVKKRVLSIKSISSIAIALGPEKTRVFLIPFMGQLMCDEEEIQKEVLLQLPYFVNFVGGSYHAHILMDIVFEYLYKCDEGAVREAALSSLKDLLKKIDLRHFEKLLIDFINRILENEHFRAKEMALSLIPEIFVAISEEYQIELLNILEKMSQDATPMVRKTVAQKLKDFAKLIPPAPENVLLKVFDRLIQDENDYVRLPLLESLIPFSQVCLEKSQEEFVEVLKKIVTDKSAKVKCTLVDFVEEIQKSFKPSVFEELILPAYLSFLNIESENDLKNKCLQSIISFYKNLPNFSTLFIPKLKALAKDKSLSVKSSLGDAVITLLTEGSKDRLQGIEDLFGELLDESDNETKFKLFKKVKDFGQLQSNLTGDVIKKILQSLQSIVQNKKWRMRSSAFSIISRLVKEAKVFESNFDNGFIEIVKIGLGDSIAEVRVEAAKTFGFLVGCFGINFAIKNLFSQLKEIQEHLNYLVRSGIMFCIKYSLPFLDEQSIKTYIFEIIKVNLADPVANIQIVALEICQEICTTFSQDAKGLFQKQIFALKSHKDTQINEMACKILAI